MFSTIYRWNCQLLNDRFSLKIGMVGRPYHRRAGDLLKPQGLGNCAVFIELFGGDVALNRQMGFAGLQVLAYGQH